MSIENNNKILIGSVSQSIDKRKVLGDVVNTSSISLLMSVIESYIYAMTQYNNGNTSYENIIRKLNEKIYQLKSKCPDICMYRDRLVIMRENTPPIIEDNIIEIPLSNINYTDLDFNEVIYNYNDAENNLISQVVIVSVDSSLSLLVDNSPAIINNVYTPPVEFDAHYIFPSNTTAIAKNTGEDCEAEILFVNSTDYNTAKNEGELIEIDGDDLIFQKIINTSSNISNDTIVYFHIDTSSISSSDQTALRNRILQWWTGFKNDNPDFGGSLIINTVNNSVIDPGGYAPGRGDNGILTITGSQMLSGTVEAWLENPTEGLLRQAYKEGLNNFPSEEAFLQYTESKSLVVMSFVDETVSEYHSNGPVYSGPHTETGLTITQPTARYTTHYNNFVYKLRPRLKFFKGVVYPITRTNIDACNAYMLHIISAIEAANLNSTQIDNLFGVDKLTFYSPTQMTNWFYNPLSNNVYIPLYNLLKPLGWEGIYSKYSPVTDTISSDDFIQELNDLLNSGQIINITTKDTIVVEGTNQGLYIDTNFKVKVRDNHPSQPMFSNEATITVRHSMDCEDIPECVNRGITLSHKENHTFSFNDFTTLDSIESIVITEMGNFFGTLKLYDLVITSQELPIIITRDMIDNGDLVYTSNVNQQGITIDNFTFELRLEDMSNNSACDNLFTITKLGNPNPYPEVFVADTIVTATESGMANVSLSAVLTYTGTDTYKIFWEFLQPYPEVSYLSYITVYMTGENTLNMTAHSVPIGESYFRVNVKTDSDGLIGSHIVKVTVNP